MRLRKLTIPAACCAMLVCRPGRAAGWEIHRSDLDTRRPPVVDAEVSIDAASAGPAFPRYLGELGVKTIWVKFQDTGSSKRTLSIVWTGGSLGPDRFAVSVDGDSPMESRKLDTVRRPYAWFRDDFAITLGPGASHVIEIRALPEYASAIEFAGMRLANPGAMAYQPLCYGSIGNLTRYEKALGGNGAVASSPHVLVFAPKAYAAQAKSLSTFLEKTYGEMKALYGSDTPFRYSVEHYPVGHPRGWGGISGEGTIGYTVEALDRFAQMGTTDVRGFAGYTEEMSHGFKSMYKCSGTYEALGVSVQEDVVRRLVPKSVADAFWLPEHKTWDETHRAYLAAGRRNPDPVKYPDGVLYTRILNDVFLKLRNEYGPKMWPDFFAQVRKMDYPLHRAKNSEYMRTYADIFTALFKREMRLEFTAAGIDLNADPPWGWQTYGK